VKQEAEWSAYQDFSKQAVAALAVRQAGQVISALAEQRQKFPTMLEGLIDLIAKRVLKANLRVPEREATLRAMRQSGLDWRHQDRFLDAVRREQRRTGEERPKLGIRTPKSSEWAISDAVGEAWFPVESELRSLGATPIGFVERVSASFARSRASRFRLNNLANAAKQPNADGNLHGAAATASGEAAEWEAEAQRKEPKTGLVRVGIKRRELGGRLESWTGGSHGLATAIAVLSARLGIAVYDDMAFSGEVLVGGSLSDELTAVPFKVRAAVDHGIRVLWVPSGKEADTKDYASNALHVQGAASFKDVADALFSHRLDALIRTLPEEAEDAVDDTEDWLAGDQKRYGSFRLFALIGDADPRLPSGAEGPVLSAVKCLNCNEVYLVSAGDAASQHAVDEIKETLAGEGREVVLVGLREVDAIAGQAANGLGQYALLATDDDFRVGPSVELAREWRGMLSGHWRGAVIRCVDGPQMKFRRIREQQD
jgi:hypothetical protein